MGTYRENLPLHTIEEIEAINATSRFRRAFKKVTAPDGTEGYQLDPGATLSRALDQMNQDLPPLSKVLLDDLAE